MNTDRLIHPEISEAIIGAAMKVLNTLKPGLDEKACENALVIELRERGHTVDQQRRFDVIYEGVVVDTLVPDLIVDGLVIADPKVTEDFTPTHIAQMQGYLAITGLRLAMLLNFKHTDLRWKRVIRGSIRSDLCNPWSKRLILKKSSAHPCRSWRPGRGP